MMTSRRLWLALIGTAALASTACTSSPPVGPTPDPPLPVKAFQDAATELVARAGVPGAIVGVLRGDQRWVGAAGTNDLAGMVPMRADGVFRAASITKMFTASLVMKAVEGGALKLDDPLSSWEPAFPNAPSITLDEMLSHTAGVTTNWFDQPALQAVVTADLTHVYTPAETIGIMAKEPPFGAPGSSGMQYTNTDYVLLGDIVSRVSGALEGDLLQKQVFGPLGLAHTTYQFDAPAGLLSGWYEYQGLTLDMASVPQESLVSFAGAAGALHTTADDLLTFADALFRKGSVVDKTSLRA